MQRRGLSDVVTTVLIILLSLVAVAIIGGVVIKNINKSAGKFDALSACQDFTITPLSCSQGGVVKLSRGSNGVVLYKLSLVYTKADGTSEIRSASKIPASYETTYVVPSTPLSTLSPIKSVQLAPSVRTADGGEFPCSPVNVIATCASTQTQSPIDSINTDVNGWDIDTKPTDLIAIPLSSTSIQFSWEDKSNNEDWFYVVDQTTGTHEFQVGPGYGYLSDTNYVIATGLTPNTAYTFEVYAIDDLSGLNSVPAVISTRTLP